MGIYFCLYMPTMIMRTRQNVRFCLYRFFLVYVFVYLKMGKKLTYGQFVILSLAARQQSKVNPLLHSHGKN